MLPELVPLLKKHKEITLDKTTENKLLSISSATIDRLLKPEKKKHQIKGLSHTKPGTLLKHQIPIRTFSEWNEQRPGFVEIDLVGHDGGDSSGEFSQTLTVTDVCTGWTDMQAVKNKAQCLVFEALKYIRDRLPFDLLGKTRVGSKVKKKYDKPQTPCQRVMASPHISKDTIKWLTHEHDKLNPAELKRSITRLQNKLIRYASSKGKTKPGP